MAQNEFSFSGRALAFGLGTASVVHTLRAVEIMLRSYYETYAGAPPAKGERGYAMYLKKLAVMAEEEERAGGRPDKRVIQMLAQVKDHYRNPLVVADVTTSVDEATQLFGMASAIISLMAEAVAGRNRSNIDPTDVKNAVSALAAAKGDEGATCDFRMKEAS